MRKKKPSEADGVRAVLAAVKAELKAAQRSLKQSEAHAMRLAEDVEYYKPKPCPICKRLIGKTISSQCFGCLFDKTKLLLAKQRMYGHVAREVLEHDAPAAAKSVLDLAADEPPPPDEPKNNAWWWLLATGGLFAVAAWAYGRPKQPAGVAAPTAPASCAEGSK